MQALFFILILSIANIFSMNQGSNNAYINLYPNQELLFSMQNNTPADAQNSNLLVPTPPEGLAPWEITGANNEAKKLAYKISLELLNNWRAQIPGLIYVKNFNDIKILQENLIFKTQKEYCKKNINLDVELLKKYLKIINKDFEKTLEKFNSIMENINLYDCNTRLGAYSNDNLINFRESCCQSLCDIAKVPYDSKNDLGFFENFISLKEDLESLPLKTLQELLLKCKQLKFMNHTDKYARLRLKDLISEAVIIAILPMSITRMMFFVYGFNDFLLEALCDLGVVLVVMTGFLILKFVFKIGVLYDDCEISTLISDIEHAIKNYIDTNIISDEENGQSKIIEML